jgi:hypothetical protein
MYRFATAERQHSLRLHNRGRLTKACALHNSQQSTLSVHRLILCLHSCFLLATSVQHLFSSTQSIHCFLRMAILTCAACLCQPERPVVTCCGRLMCWGCLRQWMRHGHDANRRRIRCSVCTGSGDPVVLVLGTEHETARPATRQPSAGLVISTRAHPLNPLASPQKVRNSQPPQRPRASNLGIWVVLAQGLLMGVIGVLIPACFVIAVAGLWTVAVPVLFAVVFSVLLGSG